MLTVSEYAGAVQRLSRAESQQRTRARIVDAATTLFLRDGFRSTSLEQVAAEAGFTRGAVHSNFDNKTDLGIAVVDQLYQREAERVQAAIIEHADQGPAGWLEAINTWGAAIIGDRHWARLEMEIAAASTTDDALLDACAARYARLRASGGLLLESLTQQAGIELPVETETLMIGLLGLTLGIGIQRAMDPTIPADALTRMIGIAITNQTSPSSLSQA
jgi:AcrR family transcriptional regulator